MWHSSPYKQTTYQLYGASSGPMLRTLVKMDLPSVGVEAPARQGARRAHTGSMSTTSNVGGRDASAARMVDLS